MLYRYVWPLVGIGLILAQEEPSIPAKRQRWGLVSHQEIAYNQFLGLSDTLRGSVEGLGSIKVNLSWIPHLRLGLMYIGAGAGLAIREVRFEEPVALFRASGRQLGYSIDSLPGSVRAKSKFQLGYLRVPVEIGFLRKKFNFAVFAYGEALLWAKHKRKYRSDEGLSRFVSYGNHNFQTDVLQYGIGARLGFRGIGIFATYNLSPLWRDGRGPTNVRALQAGIYFFEAGKLGRASSTQKARMRSTS
ncbi:MAG: hypothetical protein N3E49_05725 [Bacteroidia bacterium]|nr:hypothetical protein [Bacteroidia bacterium]